MHDALGVRVGECPRNLPGDVDGVLQRQLRLTMQPGAEGLTVHEGHHVVEKTACLAGLDYWKDIRMLES